MSEGRSIRIIDNFNSPIRENEYRIALRLGKLDEEGNRDYHLMVQTRNGFWAEKHGYIGGTELHCCGNPNSIIWTCPGEAGPYYIGRIVYLAISQ